jgi:hypothetical protein
MPTLVYDRSQEVDTGQRPGDRIVRQAKLASEQNSTRKRHQFKKIEGAYQRATFVRCRQRWWIATPQWTSW